MCASIVGDVRYADMIRRRALVVLLTSSTPTRGAAATGRRGRAARAGADRAGLGELQAYAALRPLERLYDHAQPGGAARRDARAAHLYFKRSFR